MRKESLIVLPYQYSWNFVKQYNTHDIDDGSESQRVTRSKEDGNQQEK